MTVPVEEYIEPGGEHVGIYLWDLRKGKYIFYLMAVFLLLLLGKFLLQENLSLTSSGKLSGWTLLSTYSTPILSNDPGREENLRLGIATIHNQALIPKQIFSFNQVSGPYEEPLGWRSAKNSMVVGSTLLDSIGGGVCQITATLYNAALLADLTIKERHPHNVVSSYIEAGRDSAVWYEGDLNLVFENNKSFPLIIKAGMQEKKVTVQIWGRGHEAEKWRKETEVLLVTEKKGQIPFEEVTVSDPNLAEGEIRTDIKGNFGYEDVKLRRIVRKMSKKREEIISVDSYQPLKKRTRIGTNKGLQVMAKVHSFWEFIK